MGAIVTQNTVTRKNLVHYTILEDLDATTYDDIVAGDTLLPANSLVTLVDGDDVRTTKLNGSDVDLAWDDAELLTVSTVGVADALAAKTEIAALTASAVANASDLATAVALVNDLKIKVNATISALKA